MEKHIKPTDSELEILQILWRLKTATVREVNEELSKHKEVGYTTTLKLMQIMHEKGLVSRTEQGRYHIYKAEIEEEKTQNLLLHKFINAAFRGSATKMVMQALGNEKVSHRELEEIKALIEKIESRN